jgi:hypothetical protein
MTQSGHDDEALVHPTYQAPVVKNGSVSMRPAPEKNSERPNALTGTGVFYTPNPGYVGPDALSYVRQGSGTIAGVRNVKIEVRP